MTIHLFRFSIISYLGQHTTGNSQKSMDSRKTMREIAEAILLTEKMRA